MKTKIFTLFILLGWILNAQVLTVNDGEVVEDGDVFVYEAPDEEMLIVVSNDTSENIFTKIIVESISNNENGNDLQLCYGGLCYSTIEEGGAYPPAGAVVITPGRTNNPNDHFINSSTGDVSGSPVIYTLKFVQVDSNENIIDGSEISFTYHFTGTLGTVDLDAERDTKLLSNTIVRDNLSLNANGHGTLSIYNVNGKKVFTQAVNSNELLNVSSLVKGYYIAVFENENGKTTQKFLKK